MRRRLALCCLGSFGGLVAIAACSQKLDLPPAEQDPTTAQPGSGSGGGGPTGDASIDGAIVDGGDGGTCTALDNTGTLVDANGVIGDPPLGLGGTIVAGTYLLTEDDVFIGSSGNPGPTGTGYRAAIRITASAGGVTTTATYEEVVEIHSNSGVQNTSLTFTGTVTGTAITSAPTCPAGAAGASLSFTATPTQLTIINNVTREQLLYTLQN